ncbi:tetratricopeptide (TPR) repeat protein [Clostridium saccharoperbutylacetonicum]|uniref:Tetratricopeptide repeat protein n=1 Tax=Clostridium saccharoperbutylacetonicum N1-4(HMT) TaxID=931276 RepID=M1MM66_9CLOT|nr:tetratricopeptide repeat protein [Clostridium saccharoperbutylacetonicum]AGF57308.1 tetratricopeptide repeat protein [Clostridium saccharoperbutylacetonicum N1-4(HMT)]NRT61929.1 tetratricopeptide (TPR) repeat protein [Clostridium saccharoperbutylacetonicum]NSB25258.1 tetratricopeptide (TPR) repeat protein [Clostridium saccharoperbutylacetonicum]NSB44627.1 tetratricopeptide (TPR) repeat protein [Clostridium saccharoperbutylacetonicum]
MEENKNIQDKINLFLEENRINVKGGTIKDEKQLSLVLNNLAMSDYEKGKLEKALYFTESAAEFYEENYYSYYIKGLVLRKLAKTKEAIDAFEKYCDNSDDSDDSLAHIYLGLSYAELDDAENALMHLRTGEKNISDEEKEKNLLLICAVYECIGNIYLKRENIVEFTEHDKYSMNYKSAVRYYKMSLKINRLNSELINRLAACYYHLEDLNKVLYCYEQAAKIAPDNAMFKDAIKELKESGVKAESAGF